jgi:Zn-dependent membrane protease YugP
VLVVLGIVVLLAVVFGPSLWARSVLARYGDERSYFPGNAGELARHLLDEAGLQEVAVEASDAGDHYDPLGKAVRLTRENLESRSLTAVVTAAHEVGHALQDRDGYGPLRTRTNLIRATTTITRLGSGIIFGTMVLSAIARSPGLTLLGLAAGITTMAINVVIHLVTLPVEFDASFNRALPILDRDGYLPKQDLPAARRILKACALTYVAAALVNLLNLWRWIRVFR